MTGIAVLMTLAAAASPLDRPFELGWFQATPTYTELLDVAAKHDLDKAQVDAVLGRVRITSKELSWVKKFASPLSPKRQRGRVRSVMNVLLSKSRVSLGKKFAADHAKHLEQVSKKYGVSVADLVAMMNAESRFGQVQGTFIVAAVFVANMAYIAEAEMAAHRNGDYDQPGSLARKDNQARVKKRERYSMTNFVTLLEYATSRKADPMSFKGSWAGAIGITQFMPASLRWAVDGDGNGVVDLSTVPDAIASTASYLVAHGYVRGRLAARKKAFRAYNPNSEYVRAIVAYADRFSER